MILYETMTGAMLAILWANHQLPFSLRITFIEIYSLQGWHRIVNVVYAKW